MTKTLIVSGCDANYYPLLREWLHSLKQLPESRKCNIAILDAGLLATQVEALRAEVNTVIKPDWPDGIPLEKVRGREFLKCCVCRPFLPLIFPGYETYIWMDADTWLQNGRALSLLHEGAKRKKITLTGNVDRCYKRQIRVKWLGRWPWKVRGFYFMNALNSFDFKTAKALMPYHVLCAGMFSLAHNAPHWEHWQDMVVKAARRGNVFTAEQLTLGIMVHLDNYPAEILPAWTQWLSEFKPLWDMDKKLFVEPCLPHEEISVMHISGFDEMRIDRSQRTQIETTTGCEVNMSLRYPYFDGEKLVDDLMLPALAA